MVSELPVSEVLPSAAYDEAGKASHTLETSPTTQDRGFHEESVIRANGNNLDDGPVTNSVFPLLSEEAPVEDHISDRGDSGNGLIAMPAPEAPKTDWKITGSVDIFYRGGDPEYTIAKWIFPWELCRTWKETLELLRQAFRATPRLLDLIDNGSFVLEGRERAIILPEVWESIVAPGWGFDIRFVNDPMFPGPPGDIVGFGHRLPHMRIPVAIDEAMDEIPSEEGEESQTQTYDAKIRYTVEYFRKIGSGSALSFMEERDCEEPVTFSDSAKEKNLPILQEITKIVRPDDRDIGVYSRVRRPVRSRSPSPDRVSRKENLRPGDVIKGKFLKIHSPLLLNALRSVITYSSQPPSGDADPLHDGKFPYPYKDLYLYKDDLLSYKDGCSDIRKRHSDEYNAECDRHIGVLVDFLYSQDTIRLKQVEEGWKKDVPVTTFGSLWLLLKSGIDVYAKQDGIISAYIVDGVSGGVRVGGKQRKMGEEVHGYTVRLWNISFDGMFLSRKRHEVYVPVFDGEREVTSLPVFPARMYRDGTGRRPMYEQLVERGRKYVQLVKGPSFREYSGEGMETDRKYEHARVVIDHIRDRTPYSFNTPADSSFRPPRPEITYDSDSEYDSDVYRPPRGRAPPVSIGAGAKVPKCKCDACIVYNADHQIYVPLTFDSYKELDPKKIGDLIDHQYFLCSSHLWGYILKDRVYDRLAVTGIAVPKINVLAIDKLVMKAESSKATIKAICQGFTSGDDIEKPFFADFIQGKGEGQIILLHGPPGTGKTLTAESVAEFTRRPLLSITAADLGHEPQALERNLLTFFRNANEWGAIVLLDEADVYLERRDTNDLKRNSIVSIFLRALDYFQGILFLTTNRVGSFDEAFISRIHVQIGYDPLDDDARSKIWDNNFRKLKEDHEAGEREIRYEWDAKEYVQQAKEVKQLNWNGREIRNAFQTAVALALYDAKGKDIPVVKESHLKQVVSMSRAFKDYIKSTHENMDESERAYKAGLRYDGYGNLVGNLKQPARGASFRNVDS